MNIFHIDKCPTKAARMLCDEHVRKMIVESAQMLANCYNDLNDAPRTQKGTVRKHSYYNHPCSKWVRNSQANFDWLLEHALEMCWEYTYRFDKEHFTEDFILWCFENPPELPNKGITTIPLCFGEHKELKTSEPVLNYRAYYKTKTFATWSKRPKPDWY